MRVSQCLVVPIHSSLLHGRRIKPIKSTYIIYWCSHYKPLINNVSALIKPTLWLLKSAWKPYTVVYNIMSIYSTNQVILY